MKRYKKVLLIIFLSLVAVGITGVVLTWVYADEIKQYGVTQINKTIQTEIEVEEIDFSVFERFPSATLIFKNTSADEVTKKAEKSTLFAADYVYFEFNIIQLIKGNYNLQRIVLSNGVVNLKIDAHGNNNFDIFKPSDSDENDLALHLNEVLLENVTVNFINEVKNFKLLQRVEKASFSGQFASNLYDLDLNGVLNIEEISFDGNNFVHHKKVFIDVEMEVNAEKKNFLIKKGALSVQDMHFFINGDFTLGVEADLLNFKISGNKLSIADLVTLVPDNYQNYLAEYNSEGEIQFNAIIKGLLNNSLNPELAVNFGIENGEVTHKKSGIKLNKIALQGKLSNGNLKRMQTTTLQIDSILAGLGTGKIMGNYAIENFNNPKLVMHAITKGILLEELFKFFPNDSITLLKGSLDLDLKLIGNIEDLGKMTIQEFRKANTMGKAKLTGFGFAYLGSPYGIDSVNTTLTFNNNDVKVSHMTGKMGRNDFNIDGVFKNLIPYLFAKNERLLLRANYTANKLYWDDFMPEQSDKSQPFVPPYDISFDLNSRINDFYFRKFHAQKIQGNLRYSKGQLKVPEVAFNAMEGKVNGQLEIDVRDLDKISFDIDGRVENVNIVSLFSSFDNFGQEQLTAKNLQGYVTADITYHSNFDKNWVADLNSISASTELKIVNGALVDFKPVFALSRFIAVEELNHIKFSSIENSIRIQNQKIFIPDMNLQSSALNLNISGIHSFNNEIEYHFNLLLRDLLSKKARKAKKENEEFGGHVQDDGLGRTTLFLKMTGTVDDPKISYDRKGLREQWRKDFKEEKATVKSILKDEFGKKEEDQKQEDVRDYEFEMEWEEGDKKAPSKEKEQINQAPPEKKKEKKKKSWFDKITEPNEDEFE